MAHYHAVVWLDHREARVFHFNADEADRAVIHPDRPAHQLHRRSGKPGSGHAAEDQVFYHHVAEAIADAGAVLVVGPGQAKLELLKHVHRHDHALVERIVGVETVDHPTDGQLLAYARTYFKAKDRTLPQRAGQ
ncbi:MAG: translational machinery protein [Alphaproteobacteria bacterium]|nr:translational machinery protein [Alphaproteobacteria bacterium]